MENNKELGLGLGYIEKACKLAGVTRGTYYNAKKRLKNSEVLSRPQLEVLEQYQKVISEAKKSLEDLKKR